MGRPITHLSHYLVGCDPILMVRQVQRTGQSLEQEVHTQEGRCHLMRVVPYTIGPKAFSGTVISFVDITEIRRAEAALRESLQLFASITNTTPALMWMAGLDKGCIWFNEPWLAFTGRTLAQEQGNGWAEGVHPDDLNRCPQNL